MKQKPSGRPSLSGISVLVGPDIVQAVETYVSEYDVLLAGESAAQYLGLSGRCHH